MTYIRQPLKGIPIRYKTIKGKEYAYQRVIAYRDKTTGQVKVQDRYLGPREAARAKPLLDQLDTTDIEIITAAWRRGEDVAWVQTYVKTVMHDEPAPDTIYKWFRAHGIKRDIPASRRDEKRITAAEAQVERIKRIKADEIQRRARQARRRLAARKEIENR